ncbi:MAG: tyrosine-type recombinase/integrase [Methylobacter sp.]|nr:tyrosine-type recombinase/integrase [Methylobacter sp.]
MTLDDLILIRGWINHLAWSVLDEQMPEGEQGSARRRLKDLRRHLARKARFYGKPEQVALWLGERGVTETWSRQALAALNQLNRLADPVPDLDQAVARWFPDTVCAALPPAVHTLAALIDTLEAIFAGATECPDTLKPSLNRLTGFFDEQARTLGYQLNKNPPSAAVLVPLVQVAPLERVWIPEDLNGEKGSNRSLAPCRIDAHQDLAAIHSWLSLKNDNAKTFQAYKKELERLLLWSVLERGKAVSSLSTDDCRAYLHFLKKLTTADQRWVTQEPANKHTGKWKPFYYRAQKSAAGPTAEGSVPQPVLAPKSINYAKTVISACLDWLVKQQYLKHNNFQDMPTFKCAQTTPQTHNRAFTLTQMQVIFAYAEQQVQPGTVTYLADRRLLFILKLAFSTGLRLHELAAASFGDIEGWADDSGDHYFLRVVGKHSKLRHTSLPAVLIDELHAYLKARGCSSPFDCLPPQAPLIPSLRDKTGRKHLTPAGLHKTLSGFFKQMFTHLEGEAPADKRLLNKLRKASAHWLRHSYGSYLANDQQVPLTYIRDELGHANISTTSVYLNTDAQQRQKVVSAAFAEL